MTTDLILLADGPRIPVDDFEELTGWLLKPEGLCRGEQCVPVPSADALVVDGEVDAAAFAALMDRPFALDEPSGVAAIGAPRSARRDALDLLAPDFVLPDIDGTPHALSDHRNKKRLLVAFSTW